MNPLSTAGRACLVGGAEGGQKLVSMDVSFIKKKTIKQPKQPQTRNHHDYLDFLEFSF